MANVRLKPVSESRDFTFSVPLNMEIDKRLKKWNRIDILLNQDEEKIKNEFCRRLPNERNNAFEERKKTFIDTFINPTQDLVTAPVNSVFNQGCKLEYENPKTSLIAKFNNNVTNSNSTFTVKRYLKEIVGLHLRAYGTVCLVIDKPRILASNREQEIMNGMPYVNMIKLQDIINWQLDENGEFDWFVYKKQYTAPWNNPFMEKQPNSLLLECMYTKSDYIVRKQGGDVIEELSYSHNWGFVPIIVQGSFVLFQNDLIGNAAMFQSSNSIINMNNCLNVGNYELYKHGGALLLMPEEARTGYNVETDSEGNTKLKKYDNNGVFEYAGEKAPEYLVKDLKAEQFMDWANFYKNSAIDNERDLKSVAKMGADGQSIQESGIAKMLDRDPLIANLVSLSLDIEITYNKIADMVAAILVTNNDSNLEFDKDYDYRTIDQKYEELKKAIECKVEDVSPSLFREHYRNIAPDTTNDQETIDIINKEIDEYDPSLIKNEDFDDEIKKELKIVDNDKKI